MQTEQQKRKPKVPKTRADMRAAMPLLRHFINADQLYVIAELSTGEEGQWFIEKMCELAAQLQAMPKTHEQDGKGDQAVCHLHYFRGGCDWWITEKDMEVEQHQAFGYAELGDPNCAEIGYISIVELLECRAEIDLHWTPKTLGEVKARK